MAWRRSMAQESLYQLIQCIGWLGNRRVNQRFELDFGRFVFGRQQISGSSQRKRNLYLHQFRRDLESTDHRPAKRNAELVLCRFFGKRQQSGCSHQWRWTLYVGECRPVLDATDDRSAEQPGVGFPLPLPQMGPKWPPSPSVVEFTRRGIQEGAGSSKPTARLPSHQLGLHCFVSRRQQTGSVVHGGGIYLSSNSGLTWAQVNAPSNNWFCVSSSGDGSKLTAGIYGGGIYTSIASLAATTSTTGTNGYIAGTQGSAVELQYIGNGQFMPVSSAGNIWAF